METVNAGNIEERIVESKNSDLKLTVKIIFVILLIGIVGMFGVRNIGVGDRGESNRKSKGKNGGKAKHGHKKGK